MSFETKNSGDNVTYEGGAKRENKQDKVKWHLIPRGPLKELAELYTRGAKVYGDRNWENGDLEYAEKCKESAFRHFMQWMDNETDEDHGSAVVWNVFAYKYLISKHLNNESKKV